MNNDLWANVISPKTPLVEDLSRVHDLRHIETIRDFGEGRYDMDTFVHRETYDIAMRAVGGGIEAAMLASHGEKAFAMIRPPGHHATRNRAMGFCYFNNIAVAASSLGKRTAIVDIDVHHGNGTNDIFHSDPNILYISTHQWGIFPGTGAENDVGSDEGKGFTVNIPLCSGSGDATFELACNMVIDPIVREFKPELLLVSIGGDAHYRDPLATLSLSTKGYLRVVDHIFSLADEFTNGGVAFSLEGGYDVPALSEIVGGIVAKALGKEAPCRFTDIHDNRMHGRQDVEGTRSIQSEYWNLK